MTTQSRRARTAEAAAATMLVVLAGCSTLRNVTGPAASSSSTSSTTSSSTAAAPASSSPSSPATSAAANPGPALSGGLTGGNPAAAARAQLEQLVVLPTRPSPAGYDRDCGAGHACSFGPAWSDVDRNGCGQRDDVLSQSMTDVVFKPGTHNCVVASGTLDDPYTGTTIHFVRGPDSAAVQVDHVVPEKYAYDVGAASWTVAQRTAFANDTTLELLAVSGPANQAKSDSGPGEWLPSNAAVHCAYVERFVAVLTAYRLAILAADKTAVDQVLQHCP